MTTRKRSSAPPGFVRRLQVESSRPAFAGASFAGVGGYDLVEGRAYCEVDPAHPLNRCIVNLEHAPRNAHGRVEYDFQFSVLAPSDHGKANRWLFFEVPNRGNKLALGRMGGRVAVNDLGLESAAADGWLLRQGFTMAWSGWQSDVPAGQHRVLANFPVARFATGPITGLCRDEILLEPTPTSDAVVELSEESFVARLSYPAASLDRAAATLTVRQRERDARSIPSGLEWNFVDDRHIAVRRPRGFDLGALYEFVYTARDPVVMGLGLAGMRDFATFLRHASRDAEGHGNPLGSLREKLGHTLAFGTSQSGRVLRDFLHLGFNEDGDGGRVFDAVLPVVTGARRSFTNFGFAQPGRFSRQHEDHLYQGDEFPFTYGPVRDTLTGAVGGLLDSALERGVAPKIAHLEVETEFWAGRSSLLVTDTEGRDVPLPDDVRLYMASGIPHATTPPPAGIVQHQHNILPYGLTLRAVLKDLVDWVEHDAAPPESVFPSRRAGTLVDFATARKQFPRIPGVRFPENFNRLRVKDYGSEPPREGAEYPVFLPAADADGNSRGGIPHPLVSVPIGTLTGWMPRGPGYSGGELYSILGAFHPFTPPSLVERYGSPDRWCAAIEQAVQDLVQKRFLLPEDAPQLIAAARRGWKLEHFA